MLRKACAVNDEVDLGMAFGALPVAHGIVDEIDARAAFGDLVGADDLMKMDADFGGAEGHGNAGEGGVFFEAAPMALVGKGFAAGDAQGREDAPAADEARLAGREAHLVDGLQGVVMKDVRMDHERGLRSAPERLL